MRFVLWCASRLLYFVTLALWFAAASPAVEAFGFEYEIISRYSPARIWGWLMLASIVTLTCAVTLHCLARIEEDNRVLRRMIVERR